MPFAVCIGLEEDVARSIFGAVGGDGEGCSKVGEMKDWFQQE